MTYLRNVVLSAVLSSVLPMSAVTTAHAADTHVSGQQLLSLCTANMGGNGNSLEAAECMGFVIGIADTFDCSEDNHGYTWNSSAQLTQPQMVNLVVKYIQSHPATLRGEGHRAIGAALQEAYPCKPKAASN